MTLSFDPAGNIYGTTLLGGNDRFCGGLGCGTVYQLMPSNGSWTETIVYEFSDANDGEYPSGGVIVDQAGNLYGTAPQTGFGSEAGSIFQLTPSGSGWKFNLLYDFSNGSDGGYPVAGLIFDSSGNLYGATSVWRR